MFSTVFDFLKDKDFKYKECVNLGSLSSIGIGPVVPLFVYPSSVEQLVFLVKYLQKSNIPYKIVGRMTNILFTDSASGYAFISTSALSRIEFLEDAAVAECGASLVRLAHLSADLGLSGLEALSGIPASVGGAIRSNAGAYGTETADLIISVRAFDKLSGALVELDTSECGFSYRHSIFQSDRYAILSASFKLKHTECNIRERMRELRERRTKSQPTNERSLGSTFKRPSGAYAAELIDKCGLKGVRVGGVKVSEKHAGFIVNDAGGTAEDYIALMSLIKNEVYSKFSVLLEPEIEIF